MESKWEIKTVDGFTEGAVKNIILISKTQFTILSVTENRLELVQKSPIDTPGALFLRSYDNDDTKTIFDKNSLSCIVFNTCTIGLENYVLSINRQTFELDEGIKGYSSWKKMSSSMTKLDTWMPAASLDSQVARNYSKSSIVTVQALKRVFYEKFKSYKYITLDQLSKNFENLVENYFVIKLLNKKGYRRGLVMRLNTPGGGEGQQDMAEFKRSDVKIWDFSRTSLLLVTENFKMLFFTLSI